jgi:hypothetical protein
VQPVKDRLKKASRAHVVGNTPAAARPFLLIATAAVVVFAGLASFASRHHVPAPPGYRESAPLPSFDADVRSRLFERRRKAPPAPAAPASMPRPGLQVSR